MKPLLFCLVAPVIYGTTLTAPTYSPVAGSYSNSQSVTLSGPVGATICYTTDGSTPTETANSCSGGTTQTYSSAITVSTSETIKALATESGFTDSSIASAAYVILAVSNVRIDSVLSPNGALTHSAPRIRWNVNTQACYHLITLTNTSNSTTSSIENAGCSLNDLGWAYSGLQPATTYTVAVQSSLDSINWSAASTQSYTTASLPFPHPSPPQIPLSSLWNPPYPNTSGYLAVTFDSTCHEVTPVSGSSLTVTLAAAATLQPSNGTVITIPYGTVCPGFTLSNDTQVVVVPTTGVNISTGVLTYSGSLPSGFNFANGQAVKLFATLNSCFPGSSTQGNDNNSYHPSISPPCPFNGPLTAGVVYYLSNVGVGGAQNFQLAYTSGGSPITSYGDTGPASFWMQQWPPQNSNKIIVQTSTPDSQFCLYGYYCDGTIWSSSMVTIQSTCGLVNDIGGIVTLGANMVHDYWFRGLLWTSTDCTSLASTTVDPQPSDYFFNFPYSWISNYIMFDRNYIHGQPFPNRYIHAGLIGGSYIGFVGNKFDNILYWRPSVTPVQLNHSAPGLSGSIAGSVITIIPGNIIGPPNLSCTVSSNITYTITGGTASGTAYFLLTAGTDVPPSSTQVPCVPTLILPTGMTATASGSATDQASNVRSAVVTTSASPGWLKDTPGGINCFTLGTFTLTSGVPSGYSSQTTNISTWFGEGAQMMNTAAGPGPFTIWRNYFSTVGLTWHFSDDWPVDSVGNWVRQNFFFWDQTYRMGSPISNGYEYWNRNGMEWKHGRQTWYDGNYMTGCWSSVSATGPCMLAHIADSNGTLTGFTIQDFDLSNNVCWMCNTPFEVGGAESLGLGAAAPSAERIRIRNNLMNTNGWTQTDGNTGEAGNGGATGVSTEIDSGIMDFIYDHNMCYDCRGTQPVIVHAQQIWMHGCQFTNNILGFGQTSAGFTGESLNNGQVTLTPAISGSGATWFTKTCTNDPNVSGGLMYNNVALPTYSSGGPGAPTGIVTPSTVCTSMGGTTLTGTACTGGSPLVSTVINQSTTPLSIAAVGFLNPSQFNAAALSAAALNLSALKLTNASAYNAGSGLANDHTDLGPDFQKLQIALGYVGLPAIKSIGTATAVITVFVADSSTACYLDYSAAPSDADASGFTRVMGTAANTQTFSLSGLTAATLYNYRIACPATDRTGTFLTQ